MRLGRMPAGRGRTTRLLLKVVLRTPSWAAPRLSVGDLIMARRQLLNLKQLAKPHHNQGPSRDKNPSS
jgi:hypothetical protein